MSASSHTEMAGAIGAVVMAAGAGRRMGGAPKSLLRRDGEPLLLRQVRLLAHAGVRHIAVVLGHHGERLKLVLEPVAAIHPGLCWVTNPSPDDGPASSLRCGLAALPEPLDAVLVTLGDQPLLQEGDAEAILQAWRARAPGIALVLPVHGGEPGHPLAFGAVVRASVQRGEAVRDWRLGHAAQVQAVAAAHARYTTDVDTPEALRRLAREHGVRLAWDAGASPPLA